MCNFCSEFANASFYTTCTSKYLGENEGSDQTTRFVRVRKFLAQWDNLDGASIAYEAQSELLTPDPYYYTFIYYNFNQL